MSFLAKFPFRRLPFVRYTAVSKRDGKIEVQLLKNWSAFGVKGEIVKVLPSVMRNKLHPQNGAAYVLPGIPPQIPVVKREKIVSKEPIAAPVIPKPKLNLKPKTASKTIKIDGLLLDFQDVTPKGSITSSDGYSLFALQQNLHTIKMAITGEDNQISKAAVQERINSLVGVQIPLSDMTFKKGQNVVESIDSSGNYILLIKKDSSDNFVEKSLVVS